jgi:hypothetical protein
MTNKEGHTMLNLEFERIYAPMRNRFGVVLTKTTILYNAAENFVCGPCQSSEVGRAGGGRAV